LQDWVGLNEALYYIDDLLSKGLGYAEAIKHKSTARSEHDRNSSLVSDLAYAFCRDD
jgi:hypothetical protein